MAQAELATVIQAAWAAMEVQAAVPEVQFTRRMAGTLVMVAMPEREELVQAETALEATPSEAAYSVKEPPQCNTAASIPIKR